MVVLLVFAEAPFRHVACFPFLLDFVVVVVAMRFEEEEEEEEEHVEEDDDLIGIRDPVTSAILYSHSFLFSLSFKGELLKELREKAYLLSRTNSRRRRLRRAKTKSKEYRGRMRKRGRGSAKKRGKKVRDTRPKKERKKEKSVGGGCFFSFLSSLKKVGETTTKKSERRRRVDRVGSSDAKRIRARCRFVAHVERDRVIDSA